MSIQFDFNTYFILEANKRILLESQKNLQVVKNINTIIKKKQKYSYKYIKHLFYLYKKHKLSFEFYDTLYTINNNLLHIANT